MQVAEYSRKRVVKAMQAVEAELGKNEYISGPTFSGADIMLVGGVRGALVRTLHILCHTFIFLPNHHLTAVAMCIPSAPARSRRMWMCLCVGKR